MREQDKFVRVEDLRHLGDWVKDTIIERTRGGVDATGKAFLPKADNSRSTINDTGRLMSSLEVEVDPVNYTTEVSTGVEYAPYVAVRRPFMGLTPSELEQFSKEVSKVFIKGAVRVSGKRLFRRRGK